MAKASERPVMDRLNDLLGGYGAGAKIARALNVTPETVARWRNGSKVPPAYLEALAELLETTPRESWPKRWQPEAVR